MGKKERDRAKGVVTNKEEVDRKSEYGEVVEKLKKKKKGGGEWAEKRERGRKKTERQEERNCG